MADPARAAIAEIYAVIHRKSRFCHYPVFVLGRAVQVSVSGFPSEKKGQKYSCTDSQKPKSSRSSETTRTLRSPCAEADNNILAIQRPGSRGGGDEKKSGN